MATCMRRSEAKDLTSYSRSVNQRRSALMSACRTVCKRVASSARVVSSTRLRTHRPTRLKTTARSSGAAHRCFKSTRGPLVPNQARVVVREPVPSVVTAQDWFPPRRLSTETIQPARSFPLYTGPQLDFDQRSETKMKYFIQLFLSSVCAAHVLAAESKIIVPGATLQTLAGA